MMTALILAFQFLTILPLPKITAEPKHFGAAMMFFPLVGFFLGGILYIIHVAARQFSGYFSPELQALLMLATLTILTRALHLDGFADFVDAFWGGRSEEDILRIMKDSHVGAFAVVGLILLILGKYLLLTQLIEDGSSTLIVLVFPMVSRWGMVLLCFGATYARVEGGLGKSFVESLRWRHLLVASVLAFVSSFFLLKGFAIWVFVPAIAVVASMRLLGSRKIDGITGDMSGATGEFIELLVLFGGGLFFQTQ